MSMQSSEYERGYMAGWDARKPYREEHCICGWNPTTPDGPQEDCPIHGRYYREWVERGDLLQWRIERVRALHWPSPFRDPTCDCYDGLDDCPTIRALNGDNT